jgi:hypothetical protein
VGATAAVGRAADGGSPPRPARRRCHRHGRCAAGGGKPCGGPASGWRPSASGAPLLVVRPLAGVCPQAQVCRWHWECLPCRADDGLRATTAWMAQRSNADPQVLIAHSQWADFWRSRVAAGCSSADAVATTRVGGPPRGARLRGGHAAGGGVPPRLSAQ